MNERIAELTSPADAEVGVFICECSSDQCAETVELTPAEYKAIRAHSDRFVVLPGHQQRERVVDGNRRFLVVEPRLKPTLLFFSSPSSGRSRRVEGFLAQVLQRRRNHDTFTLHRIDPDSRPDLAERFLITSPPVLVVVENRRIRARLEHPRGCAEIQKLLAPWLR